MDAWPCGPSRTAPACSDVPIRVLVVDDSALMRRVLADHVAALAGFVVVGTARRGDEVLHAIDAWAPDVVTLDITMPGADGIETLRTIQRDAPRPVVMVSAATTAEGQDAAVLALALGAIDFVRKPASARAEDVVTFRSALGAALRTAAAALPSAVPRHVASPPRRGRSPAARAAAAPTPARRVVAIACSTGGPQALSAIVPALDPGLGAAVVIVQHMPAGFTTALAARLDTLGRLPVHEAAHGDVLWEDHIYVAPGGWHLGVAAGPATATCALTGDPPVWGVRPAADPCFRALAARFGAALVGVVLTGMGRDGAAGLAAVRAHGGHGIVQDPATALLASMPQAAIAAGGAHEVVPLPRLGAAIHAAVAARG